MKFPGQCRLHCARAAPARRLTAPAPTRRAAIFKEGRFPGVISHNPTSVPRQLAHSRVARFPSTWPPTDRPISHAHQLDLPLPKCWTGTVRFLVLAVMAGAWAQGNDPSSPEGIPSTGLLEQIKQRVIEDLAGVHNYVCVDSIERSLWISGERQFRRLGRMHDEVAHIAGADRFSWLGNSTFNSRNPSTMVGYGASFGGSFADKVSGPKYCMPVT